MKLEEAKEGLKVYDWLGEGTLHKNVEHPEVSEWFVRWDDDSETAVLDFEQLFTIEP